jgi:CRISPR/Cas system-associated endonuclease Cas1
MAASHNLPQLPNSSKSPIGKSGVLTIHGFGVRVRMQSGHLEVEDGLCAQRRKIRLPRVGHGLRRLVCISEDGFTTLSALKWLADVGASFVFLNRAGKVLFVTGPTAPSDVRLRRAQSLAITNGVGLEISRTLIDAKLKGQERLVRERLHDSFAAQEIATFREKLSAAETPLKWSGRWKHMRQSLTSAHGEMYRCSGPKPICGESRTTGVPWGADIPRCRAVRD